MTASVNDRDLEVGLNIYHGTAREYVVRRSGCMQRKHVVTRYVCIIIARE